MKCHKKTVPVLLWLKIKNWVRNCWENPALRKRPPSIFFYYFRKNVPLRISEHFEFQNLCLGPLHFLFPCRVLCVLRTQKLEMVVCINSLNVMRSFSVTSSWLFHLPSGHCCYQAESADLTQVPRLGYRKGTASTLCTTSINSQTWSTCQ